MSVGGDTVKGPASMCQAGQRGGAGEADEGEESQQWTSLCTNETISFKAESNNCE